MIIVTGGAGFIGSNLVRALVERGHDDVVVVDNLTDSRKFENLAGVQIADFIDKGDFLRLVVDAPGSLGGARAIFHQGACTSTTEPDGRYMMRNNHDYSKAVLDFCLGHRVPLVYASSAAVYGGGSVFREEPELERPLNVYGLSKALFDAWVRRVAKGAESQVVGLRYFNVYGPREGHKGSMASLVLQLDDQIAATGRARLFGATPGYEPGEQRRDFVCVKDVVDVNLWLLDHPEVSGIFNCGSGESRTFNDLARAVIAGRGAGEIEYIPFPESLEGLYQSFTEADLSRLREAGYTAPTTRLEDGVAEYLAWRRSTGAA